MFFDLFFLTSYSEEYFYDFYDISHLYFFSLRVHLGQFRSTFNYAATHTHLHTRYGVENGQGGGVPGPRGACPSHGYHPSSSGGGGGGGHRLVWAHITHQVGSVLFAHARRIQHRYFTIVVVAGVLWQWSEKKNTLKTGEMRWRWRWSPLRAAIWWSAILFSFGKWVCLPSCPAPPALGLFGGGENPDWALGMSVFFGGGSKPKVRG